MNDEIFYPESGVGRRIKDFYIQKFVNVVDNDKFLSDEEINHLVPEQIAIDSPSALLLGEEGKFLVDVVPTLCGIPTIQWESSDYNVLWVDSEGHFMAKGLGTATVTASMVENVSVNSSISIEVVAKPVPPTPPAPSFAGLEIANGDLYYTMDSFEIAVNPYINSYGYQFGLNDGSTYFGKSEVNDVNLEGYRLPTSLEWTRIIATYLRDGSTVNGRANSHYCLVKLEGEVGGFNNPNGLLLFPDGLEISGAELTTIDSDDQTTGLTQEDIDNYISQGCAFLLATGNCEYSPNFSDGGVKGDFRSAWSESDGAYVHFLEFTNYDRGVYGYEDEGAPYYACRLVRPVE